MSAASFALIFVFLTNFCIEPIASALPTDLRNIQLDEITSSGHEFPSIISRISKIANDFYCPKEWEYFGGSCYSISKLTSTPSQADHTCHYLHFNHSKLMQIHNTIELLYAAHALRKNNFSALMIDIDPDLLNDNSVTKILLNDQSEWEHMRDRFRELRVGYYELKKNIINELNGTGLRISRRSKICKQKFNDNHTKSDYYNELQSIKSNFSTITTDINECEYISLDFEVEIDEFKHINDSRGICDEIDWNIANNTSTIYILTTSLISNKTICSLNNVEFDVRYPHVCENVLNFCFANVKCGKYGRCLNTLTGFKCSCSFLYNGLHCDKISNQGKQIIVCLIVIFVIYVLSLRPIRWIVCFVFNACMIFCTRCRGKHQHNKQNNTKHSVQKTLYRKTNDENHEEVQEQCSMDENRSIVSQEERRYVFLNESDTKKNANKCASTRFIWVSVLSVFFLILLLSATIMIHLTTFKGHISSEPELVSSVNYTIQLAAKCRLISSYRIERVIFPLIALALILILSWTIKRERQCLHCCYSQPSLIPPLEPYRLENRFAVAIVFGILAFEILKAFEEHLFCITYQFNYNILDTFLVIIGLISSIGLQYYPILASLQLRNIIVRFLVCLYLLTYIIYTILREGLCMDLLPVSGYYATLTQAKFRIEHGIWFYITFGLIKNTPYFILLSCITAELLVRFVYDSIYIPIKTKQSIWSPSIDPSADSIHAKYYVTKLLRRSPPFKPISNSTDIHVDELDRKSNQSCIKNLLGWNDDFHFTTIAICTYIVAVSFLYYLAYTLVVLYLLKPPSHILYLKHYMETTFDIKLQGFFSLNSIITISAIIAIGIIVLQLGFGLMKLKKHKLDAYNGIYTDIPASVNFRPSTIASKSIHFFGFLVAHTACGFIILSHLIICILYAIRIIFLHISYTGFFFGTTVSIFVAYLLAMSWISLITKYLSLQNRKIYAVFIYFNLFFDCFLGFIACITRLIQTTFFNVIFIVRLDCSLHGKSTEKFDLAFSTYVSYLHMEITQTNPIMLAFCYLLYDDIIQRRTKHADNDERNIELKPMITKYASSKMKNPKNSQIFKRDITNDSEDEEEEQLQDTLSQTKRKSLSNISAVHSTTDHLNTSRVAHQFERIKRQKIARFRWFLAYTILNNLHLFDLRKNARSRLALLRIQRCNIIDNLHAHDDTASQQSVAGSETSEFPPAKFTASASKGDISFTGRSSPLIVTKSDVNDYHQSSTEHYTRNSTDV